MCAVRMLENAEKHKHEDMKTPFIRISPGSKEQKGDITDAVRPTIRLYMLCRQYSI